MTSVMERKRKYGPKPSGGNNNTNRAASLVTTFDIVALDLLCSFVVSENRNIKRANLISLRTLLGFMDMGQYMSDPEKMKRIDFIRLGLEARLERNLNNKDIVLKYIYGGLSEVANTSVNVTELSNDEIDWVVSTIAGAMEYMAIDNYCLALIETLTKFKTADYVSKRDIVEQVKSDISVMHNEFRKVKTATSNSEYFSLQPEIFVDRVTNVYNELKNPSHILRSGMQGVNAMLHGGFESTRVYMFMGLPGEGKSLVLLNLAYQITQCNRDFRPKDPTKRPCVVYLTMENMDRETISRLYNIAVGNGSMTDGSLEEAIYNMQYLGQLSLNTPYDIDLIIKYVPDFSVDTSFLYDFTEDLRDDGREVCCFIQDYIKKIRPLTYTGDPYNDLGAVVNEFKNYAVWADVPVISAAQCNRDAARVIDQKRRTNSTDLVRELGRDNAGDSIQIINNADAIIMLNPEYDNDDNKYLGLNLVKRRYTNTYIETPQCIYLPFERGNGIKLLMDLGGQPLFRESMTVTSENPMNLGINPTSTVAIRGTSYMAQGSIVDMSTPPDKPDVKPTLNLFDSGFSSETVNETPQLINPFVFDNFDQAS